MIYREDSDAQCDPDYGYLNRLHTEQMEFPPGANDEEILLEARKHEIHNEVLDAHCAGERIVNRRLISIFHIAREIPV